MKSKASAAIALAALLGAGLLAALALAPAASAWSPTDLPAGWTVHHIVVSGVNTCAERYQIFEYDSSGKFVNVSPEFCTDSSSYQADFDAWVNDHYTPPATTAPTTTADTATSTTDPAATTTTSTDATSTDQTSTDATTTDAAPAPAPAPPVTDTTTTTAAPAPVCDVQCQIADLQSQIDSLRGQLGQLVQILETWPGIDPGILSELMAVQP